MVKFVLKTDKMVNPKEVFFKSPNQKPQFTTVKPSDKIPIEGLRHLRLLSGFVSYPGFIKY